MGRLLTQKEIDEIRDAYYNWDKIFESNMENEKHIGKLKGIALPQNEYFYKKKHPHKWAWQHGIKKVLSFFNIHIKFNYPPDGPKFNNSNK